uniref:Venom peptide ECTX1-Rm12a n=1 Tax=Rhytidoponera metallica TaxID=148364 RepID=A0A8U0LU08_RHYMT|nr:venom peptide precursor ECTX1-Rm12a [Rhytidoponera metallica]
MKRIYFLFAIIAIVVLTAQAFSEADADAEAEGSLIYFTKTICKHAAPNMKSICRRIGI